MAQLLLCLSPQLVLVPLQRDSMLQVCLDVPFFLLLDFLLVHVDALFELLHHLPEVFLPRLS
jgi:hypothetical protein